MQTRPLVEEGDDARLCLDVVNRPSVHTHIGELRWLAASVLYSEKVAYIFRRAESWWVAGLLVDFHHGEVKPDP